MEAWLQTKEYLTPNQGILDSKPRETWHQTQGLATPPSVVGAGTQDIMSTIIIHKLFKSYLVYLGGF